MEIEHFNTGTIKPETAQQILKKHGLEVSIDEAKNILDFLFFMTNLSVDQIVDQDKNH